MSQKLHGGIDAVMQGYADVFCDSCSYINTKYGTKDFSLPHAFALGVLDASPARLFKLAKKTYEGARAGYRAASGAAKAGDSVLDSLTPLVRSNVDDAVKRAASGKVRFPGHDGKPYKNSDGSLPAGGNYTEWTAAGAGAKRGAHRVIIDGDPANPNAIYYWDHVKPPVRIGP